MNTICVQYQSVNFQLLGYLVESFKLSNYKLKTKQLNQCFSNFSKILASNSSISLAFLALTFS